MIKSFSAGLITVCAGLLLVAGVHADGCHKFQWVCSTTNECDQPQAEESPCYYECQPECEFECQPLFADECAPCGWGFKEGAEFIYFKPSSDRNTFANVLTGNTNVGVVKYYRFCYDWEPGFRVRFVKSNLFCCWDLSAQFTRLTGNQSGQAFGVIQEEFQRLFASAQAKINFSYNNFDLLLGKRIDLAECHHLMPFFGLDMLWISQKFNRYFEGEPQETDTLFNRNRWKSDVNAYGLKAGSLYSFTLGCGFELYGTAAGSILYGKTDLNHRFVNGQFVNATGVETITNRRNYKNEPCQSIFGWQVGAGINYKTYLCSCPIAFNLGYQFIQWYNVVGSINEASIARHNTSSFGLQGLVAGVNVGF